MNVLFDRSALPTGTGGFGLVSAALAASIGTGEVLGAEGGGVRARDAAVRCSAVYIRQPESQIS